MEKMAQFLSAFVKLILLVKHYENYYQNSGSEDDMCYHPLH
jgi:hypothetical protein